MTYLHHPERNSRSCETGIDFGYPKPIFYPKAKIHFDLPESIWHRFLSYLLIGCFILSGLVALWPNDPLFQFIYKLILIDITLISLVLGFMYFTKMGKSEIVAYLFKILFFALIGLLVFSFFGAINYFLEGVGGYKGYDQIDY